MSAKMVTPVTRYFDYDIYDKVKTQPELNMSHKRSVKHTCMRTQDCHKILQLL